MAYPVLNIRNFAPKNRRKALLGMKRYVWTFEQMMIEWGVLVSWSPHAGVWVQKRKIYTIGVNNSYMVNDMTSLVLVLHRAGMV